MTPLILLFTELLHVYFAVARVATSFGLSCLAVFLAFKSSTSFTFSKTGYSCEGRGRSDASSFPGGPGVWEEGGVTHRSVHAPQVSC